MRLIEWEVAEDGYEEQIVIPKEKRDLAAQEGISTENKQKVTVQIMNLKRVNPTLAGWPLLEIIRYTYQQKYRKC